MKRARVDTCIACAQPVVLHFDAHGRKLDCARVPTVQDAITYAYTRIGEYTKYVARLERALGRKRK